MSESKHDLGARSFVPLAIALLVGLYALALTFGWPQAGTQQIVAGQATHDGAPGENTPNASAHEPAEDHAHFESPPSWTVIPFALLLGAIAVFPLIPGVSHWWESNRNRFLVAIVLALVTLAYYAFLHGAPMEAHWPAHHVAKPTSGSVQTGFVRTVFENAIFQEFVPFIVLLFSLYTITGGIRITGDVQAHPAVNAIFLTVGALLASFIGTTGAAMLLIRPLLETNRERKHVTHTIVFFIFIVCNCGGCLLPLGDPPLFLGYLQGVPFLWTLVLWKEWLFVNGILIFLYLLIDSLWHYRRETVRDLERDVEQIRRLEISGSQVNIPLLVGVVLAVAFLDPSQALPGTNWHPWMYLREIVQLTLVAISLTAGSKQVRYANRFNYHAIVEVAALFTGIFITMQPALQILSEHGDEFGLRTPTHYFWATGCLSSVLDNAPTYLVFFKAAQALPLPPGKVAVAGVEEMVLMGISLGAVFMGAMTYIGNGPNFMVRAIAESSGVKMPSFFGYMLYSCVILLPVLALMEWIYLLFPYR